MFSLVGCNGTLGDASTGATDSGATSDIGVPRDIGVARDSGEELDASTAFDMGTAPLDAGFDLGAFADLGLAFDAGPPLVARYYVAVDGSDDNAGTIEAPFATWGKLSSVMEAGDLAYIRGGTYRSPGGAGAWSHCAFEGLNGSPGALIKIWAYPGEHPVLALDDFMTTVSDPTGIIFSDSNYVHLKGLRVTGLQQNRSSGISRGFDLQRSSNNLLELIEVDHIGGYGVMISRGSNDNYFLNCDVHHTDDRWSSDRPWTGSNGFNCTGDSDATRNTFDGCRAWWNSDDGFDFFSTDGVNTIKNSWAFWNGYEPGTFTQRGDGCGYKLGPTRTSQHDTVLRFISNSLAFENTSAGFSQNVADTRFEMHNNTSFRNGEWGYIWDYVMPAPVSDFRNNLSYMDPSARRGDDTIGSHNSWNIGVVLTDTDFLSVSSAGADGPRNADGSLPRLDFLRLSAASALIDRGEDLGRPFSGTAPDIGAFER